ncbi:prepilin-type N-terminal cleavage/methylation domain-containing protein, partial [Salmonella enterica subsp. enterica serovar Enteritidis]|nr:prepilin-type N-terminal cleavage/methylation domain-containing protein [Salmonella enterica subsp. enterica serovar Enteritidis]
MPLFGSYFQMGDIIMIKKRGFTLLEITIVLGIGSLIGFMKFQDMRK